MDRSFTSSPSLNGKRRDRDSVAAYLDRLNGLWKQAEEELAAMEVAIPVEIQIKEEYGAFSDTADEPDWHDTVFLGWRKPAKEWRLCVGILRNDLSGAKPTWEWTPVAESTRERRIELAEHYGTLKVKLKELRKKIATQAAAAIASLEQALSD